MGHFEKRENGATSFFCPYWEIQLRRRGCRRFWFCGTWRFCRVVWVDTIPFLIYGCHVASDVGNAIGHHISPFCDIVESTVVARAGGKLNTRECLAARCGEPRKLEPLRGCSPSVSIDTKQWQCHKSVVSFNADLKNTAALLLHWPQTTLPLCLGLGPWVKISNMRNLVSALGLVIKLNFLRWSNSNLECT